MWWPFRRCKHDWSVLAEVYSASGFRQAFALGFQDFADYPKEEWFFRELHMRVLACKVCGKLKEMKTAHWWQ